MSIKQRILELRASFTPLYMPKNLPSLHTQNAGSFLSLLSVEEQGGCQAGSGAKDLEKYPLFKGNLIGKD